MLDLFPNIAPTTATLIAAGASILFGAHVHFFKWITKRFDLLFEKVDNLSKEHRTQLDVHEGRDQQRHEENLGRFQQINVSLARLEENVEEVKTNGHSK